MRAVGRQSVVGVIVFQGSVAAVVSTALRAVKLRSRTGWNGTRVWNVKLAIPIWPEKVEV